MSHDKSDVITRVRAKFARPEPGTIRLAPKVQLPSAPTYGTAILGGLQGKHIYGGTVPPHVVARRRAANRVARASRRVNRRRAS